jgi:hypothetical protein
MTHDLVDDITLGGADWQILIHGSLKMICGGLVQSFVEMKKNVCMICCHYCCLLFSCLLCLNIKLKMHGCVLLSIHVGYMLRIVKLFDFMNALGMRMMFDLMYVVRDSLQDIRKKMVGSRKLSTYHVFTYN